jgi:hypothetical protein
MVQLRAEADSMPIEDPTIIWNEDAAPFVPVASITIPPQSFDSPEQLEFCTNLSFTPWHCIDAHRPLGGTRFQESAPSASRTHTIRNRPLAAAGGESPPFPSSHLAKTSPLRMALHRQFPLQVR